MPAVLQRRGEGEEEEDGDKRNAPNVGTLLHTFGTPFIALPSIIMNTYFRDTFKSAVVRRSSLYSCADPNVSQRQGAKD